MVEGCVCQEYLAICEEYGVEVTDEDLKNVLAIADEDGEVRLRALQSLQIRSF